MPKLPINPQQFVDQAKRLENWFYDQGFDQGFKDKSLVIPAGAIAGICFLGFMWINSIGGKVAQAKEQILHMESRAKTVAEYREILALWTKAKGDALLPANKDAKTWLQEQVALISRDTNIELVASNQAGAPKSFGQISWQDGSFELRGSYHDLGRFVARIENSKPFIGIADLGFQRMGEMQAGGKILLAVRLEVFTLMESPPPAAAKSG
ncbi:MAG: hypothetical protein HY547_05980 [Elusimicrobia bacterium]|nr:hypothetical protein [Elusimicrobiota bacterium]